MALYLDVHCNAPFFFSLLCQVFNCSELVENDEAHPDVTEELDWYVHIANDYQKRCSTIIANE